MRNGILIGGNWIIDQVKMIDVFPEEEKLVNIFTESSSNGGSAYNISMALVRMQAAFRYADLAWWAMMSGVNRSSKIVVPWGLIPHKSVRQRVPILPIPM